MPISITDMRNYIKEKKNAATSNRPPPPLPRSADVWMAPGGGKGKDGWWKSEEFWMQIELAMDIFDHVSAVLPPCRYSGVVIPS